MAMLIKIMQQIGIHHDHVVMGHTNIIYGGANWLYGVGGDVVS